MQNMLIGEFRKKQRGGGEVTVALIINQGDMLKGTMQRGHGYLVDTGNKV